MTLRRFVVEGSACQPRLNGAGQPRLVEGACPWGGNPTTKLAVYGSDSGAEAV
jgi:hypothetical protein